MRLCFTLSLSFIYSSTNILFLELESNAALFYLFPCSHCSRFGHWVFRLGRSKHFSPFWHYKCSSLICIFPAPALEPAISPRTQRSSFRVYDKDRNCQVRITPDQGPSVAHKMPAMVFTYIEVFINSPYLFQHCRQSWLVVSSGEHRIKQLAYV